MTENQGLQAGWAQVDITPDRNVLLAGQFHARVSEGVKDPVTATALALEGCDAAGKEQRAILVSCDLAMISDELRDAVRAHVAAGIPEIDPLDLVLGATHAHSAPEVRRAPYGMGQVKDEYKHQIDAGLPAEEEDQFGVWPNLGLDVMSPAGYIEFAAERIAAAAVEAWTRRARAGIAYGLGHAVVGRNRRLTYQDGSSRMYGKAGLPEFRHVEGYEDHSVYVLMTYDRYQQLTGMLVNIPCPAQVSETIYQISADFWHEARQALRRGYGAGLFVLGQCAPAGDQSPHVLIGRRAEERMWRLKGRPQDENAPRAEIADRIADAVGTVLPYAQREIDEQPLFGHVRAHLELPRRMLSEHDVAEALAEARPYKEKYARLFAELENHPDLRKQPRWYQEITGAYRRMERGARVAQRYAMEQAHPRVPIEVHALRLGETALATNPFELYLDYAVRIRELSPAAQTFLVQKAGSSGTYLPSARSIASGGYGSVPASTEVGPEGGDVLVAWTVEAVNELFA